MEWLRLQQREKREFPEALKFSPKTLDARDFIGYYQYVHIHLISGNHSSCDLYVLARFLTRHKANFMPGRALTGRAYKRLLTVFLQLLRLVRPGLFSISRNVSALYSHLKSIQTGNFLRKGK